ncbi:uncharacterized protein LOC121389540 [Gigantopelta aegis]|uniref:uncharacterized protein LOC121389540 n=1 Tax=Gigantopelta aegis TaxID=1735272 RepID=UPI001B8896B7|nr:uncharacterized protein LOC121389540 [Gigantopelta aegis]
MPSMWSCLCMKRKRICLTRRSKTRKRRSFMDSDSASDVSSNAYRQLTPSGEFDVKFTGANATAFSFDSDGHCDGNTMTKLLKNSGPKRRRRVQDIFSQTPAEHGFRDSYESSEGSSRFSSEYCPRKRDILTALHGHGNTFLSPGQESESMYGYIPKTMQNVYASTALEGCHVEDYFSNCRPNAALGRFASADMYNNRERAWNENRTDRVSIVHTKDTFGDSGGHITGLRADVNGGSSTGLYDEISYDPSNRLCDDVIGDPSNGLGDDVIDTERRFSLLETSTIYSSEPLIVGSCPDTSLFSSQTLFVSGIDDDMLY